MKKLLILSILPVLAFELNADQYSGYSDQGYYNQPQSGYYQNSTMSSQDSYGQQAMSQNPYSNPNMSQGQYNQGYQGTYQNPSSQGAYQNPSYQGAYQNPSYQGSYQNPMSDTSAQSASRANEKYPQDSFATEADRQLNDKIRNKISGWFKDKYKNVTLNTNNGNVTASGFVRSNSDLDSLQSEIRKVDGVRSFNSNIQIRNQ